MSQENSQLSTGITPCSVLEDSPNSGIRESNSFADLIRAREQQQQRIRAALEEQNRLLRARLGSEEAIPSISTSLPTTTNTTTANAPHTHRRSHITPSVKQQQQQQQQQQVVPVEEFITFVTEMKELVNCAQQADLVALQALQDRVEFQNRNLMQRITELEAYMIAAQRRDMINGTASIMNSGTTAVCGEKTLNSVQEGEHYSLDYVMREMEKVRGITEEAIRQIHQWEDVMSQQQAVMSILEKDLNTLEEKVIHVESMPTLFRREATALEERHTSFTHRIQEEITQLQQLQLQRCEEKSSTSVMEHQIRELEKQMQTLTSTMMAITEKEENKKNIEVLNDFTRKEMNQYITQDEHEEMQEFLFKLESSLTKKIEELDTRIDMCASDCRKLSELTVKNSSCEEKEKEEKEEENPNERVAKPLMDSQSMHNNEFSERLQNLETTVNTMILQTDSKPATEEYDERIALLTKEVEGAATILEGVIAHQASASSDKLILDTVQLNERVSRLETQVQVIQEYVNDSMDKVQETTKVVSDNNEENMSESAVNATATNTTTANNNDNDNDDVSINKTNDKGKYNRNTNNGENETDKPTANTEIHWQQDRIHRHLQEELELASADLHTQAIEQLRMTYNIPLAATTANGNTVNEDNSSSFFAMASPPPPPYTTPMFAVHHNIVPRRELRLQSSQPLTQSFGPYKAPPVPISAESLSKVLAETRARKLQKEEAVVKVIESLRDVQRRFEDLSAREMIVPSSGRRANKNQKTPSHTSEDSAALLEFIVTQKEAVHAKERTLLDLRNTLWREIAQLEEDERELLLISPSF